MLTAQVIDSYPDLGSQDDPIIPGVNQTYDSSMPAPLLTKNEGWWESAQQLGKDAWDISGQVGQAIFDAVEEGYDKVASAAGRVTKDVTQGIAGATETIVAPVEKTTGTIIFYGVVVIAVLGVAIYYGGKSGGLRVSI